MTAPKKNHKSLKVEQGVALPPAPSNTRYPFAQLKVGDSFFAAADKADSACASVSYWARKTGFKFTSRSVDGGVRIWRIE